MKNVDVLIVGGGPAGSACAWRLKQQGVDCLILDQHDFPRPKTCAGWITPEVLSSLDFQREEYPFSFTTFTRFFIRLRKFRFKLRTRQHAIRRVEFDDWLLRRSRAELKVHKVRSIIQKGSSFNVDGLFSAKYIVGAGGTYCPVYRTIFKNKHLRKKEALIVAQEEEFFYPETDGECRLWFFQNQLPGYSWYVPKENGFINIGVGAKAERLIQNQDSLRNHWNYLVNSLEEQGLIRNHSFRPAAHTYYLRREVSDLRKGNAFLAGDAAGLSTLDMGEGIGAAVQSGLLAADAIVNNQSYSIDSIPKYSFLSIIKSGFLPNNMK